MNRIRNLIKVLSMKVEGNNSWQNGKNIAMSVIVCISSGIMLIMNIIKHSTLMTVTSVILFVGFAVTGFVRKAFGDAVTLARMGGDEFALITYGSSDEMTEKIKLMKEHSEKHTGRLVGEVHLSAGAVCRSGCTGLSTEELYRAADKQMYQDKSAYYRQKGHDRRQR